jgi:serine/threonine protein kinase
MLSLNQVLQEGRYRIVGQTGQEDTGLTYQAFDNVLNTNVIIKETVFDTANQPLVSKQLEGLVSIKHESFLKVHTYFSEVNRQYLVTESVEGENLQSLLEKKKRPFLLFDVLSWTEQLLDALIYLHSKTPPVIHDKIAPQNLTLIKDNKIKLLNSAIHSGKYGSQRTSLGPLSLPYTSLESFWDTLDPASQKVILNSYHEKSAETLESPIDERSDIYALGATVYYLATGIVPVDALERSIDLLERKEDPLTSPSKINPQIPRNFSHFLLKSLELKREDRFDSASAMRLALQPMIELMKKVERETQKALEDPKVREAALREVELAREALRKQKQESLQQSPESLKVQPLATEAPQFIEPPNPVPPPIPQAMSEKYLPTAEVRPQEVEKIEAKVEPQEVEKIETRPEPVLPQTQNFEAKKVESQLPEKSVLVASAPIQPVPKLTESYETMIDDEPDLFASAQTKSGKSWLIPVICVVLVLLVGGFFGFQYLKQKKQEETNQEAVKSNEPANTEATPTVTATPISEMPSTVNNQTNPSSANPTPTLETPKEDPAGLTDDKTRARKVTAPPPQTIDKKPTPAAKAPTPKKKELTVDDIIH